MYECIICTRRVRENDFWIFILRLFMYNIYTIKY